MNLTAKLEKLKAAAAAVEQKINEQRAARSATLGALVPLMLEHPAVRALVKTDSFKSRLSRAQSEALADVLSEAPETTAKPQERMGNNAGGVSVGPKQV